MLPLQKQKGKKRVRHYLFSHRTNYGHNPLYSPLLAFLKGIQLNFREQLFLVSQPSNRKVNQINHKYKNKKNKKKPTQISAIYVALSFSFSIFSATKIAKKSLKNVSSINKKERKIITIHFMTKYVSGFLLC